MWNRKTISTAVCAILLSALAVTGCQSGNAAGGSAAGEYKDGTYTASEQGFAGEVSATVVVEGGKITDVQLEGKDETPDKGGAAIEELQPKILKAQSAEVDAVTGATVTSEAVKKAVSAALEQAKG